MAKIVKLTEKEIRELYEDFEKALQKAKLSDGKVSFEKSFAPFARKATLYFTQEAHEKMMALVHDFDKEVAWHGVAARTENVDEDGYVVSDTVVYPQQVTATTVEMDEVEYSKWITANIDDERFGNLKLQGHSHVNMGVMPSGTDLKHQSDILRMLPKNGFYIFVIVNKKGEIYSKIYDLEKNVMFENSDVEIVVLPEESNENSPTFLNVTQDEEKILREMLRKLRSAERTDEFVKNAKTLVSEKKPLASAYQGNGSQYSSVGGYGYGLYGSGSYYGSGGSSKPVEETTVKKEETKTQASEEKPGVPKKRRGKRKKKQATIGFVNFDDGNDDDDGDPVWDYWKRH